MTKSIYIYHHLGLGDSIICSGIVRQLAKEYDLICVPCKYHNLESINYLYHDLEQVAVRAVVDDEEATMFGNQVWKGEKLYLGVHGEPPFFAERFDQEFYRQAGMSMQLRWDNFFVKREPAMEAPVLAKYEEKPFCQFTHDDPERGFVIQGKSHKGFQPDRSITGNIFAYIPVLERVDFINCINSSFALLVDSIALPQNPKLFLHAYARPSGEMPILLKPWTILNKPNLC